MAILAPPLVTQEVRTGKLFCENIDDIDSRELEDKSHMINGGLYLKYTCHSLRVWHQKGIQGAMNEIPNDSWVNRKAKRLKELKGWEKDLIEKIFPHANGALVNTRGIESLFAMEIYNYNPTLNGKNNRIQLEKIRTSRRIARTHLEMEALKNLQEPLEIRNFFYEKAKFKENEHVIAMNILQTQLPKYELPDVFWNVDKSFEVVSSTSLLVRITEHNAAVEKSPWLGLYSTDMCEPTYCSCP